jgi:hypothetical protein
MLKLYFSIKDLLRILLRANYQSRKNIGTPGCNRKLRILGNGKSLNDESLVDNSAVDYMVVNRHVLADNYQTIKPRYYVFADPFFFNNPKGVDILRQINELTSWPMTVMIPYSRGIKKEYSQFFSNSNIILKTYNMFSFQGYTSIAYWCYDHQLAMPVAQNVIVGAIMMGISMKYHTIELYGVEHDWLRHLYVGDDNLVYLENDHFYDKEKVKPLPQKEIQHLDEYPLYMNIGHYARMFQSYWEIKKYINDRKIATRIINMTKHSFIDAFERRITC